MVAAIGNFLTTGMCQYYAALSMWYDELGSGHRDTDLAEHNRNLSNQLFYVYCGFTVLCCLVSAGLLGGTIFWVRKMTLTED
jgi:hypothetical protein